MIEVIQINKTKEKGDPGKKTRIIIEIRIKLMKMRIMKVIIMELEIEIRFYITKPNKSDKPYLTKHSTAFFIIYMDNYSKYSLIFYKKFLYYL